jgi:GTPase SAR1 family protein
MFLFADRTTTENQNPNVGMATMMIKIPIKEPPLKIATTPAMNAKILPTKTSAIISAVATQAAFPVETPFLTSHAILTISPPIKDGVVCVTNSPPILAFIVLRVVLIFGPMKWLMKYLNLYACNKIRTITADTESRNGSTPTENTSAGETGVKANNNKNGTRLTVTAIILHFKLNQCKIVDSHIIINRINIFTSLFQLYLETIFVTGTAGSGKSLLTSKLIQWYKDNNFYPISLNLDPGVISLPYEPDVDVRNYIDIDKIMSDHNLGPNGALIMAADLIATKLNEIQEEVFNLNPDFVIVDTPGQIELFIFRASGPYFVSNFQSDNKINIFTFDGILASSTPINFISIALMATSVRLRLNITQIDVMTKRDLVIDKLQDIIRWSSKTALEDSLQNERNIEYSILSKDLLQVLFKNKLMQNPILISSLTMSGMVNLTASLSRVLNLGEEKGD